jgi:4'-phosphopantetheinyl transferase
MTANLLKLWCAYPGDLQPEEVAAACSALLSDAERARVARYKFERFRRESLATRALMRVALSHSRPVPPQAWNFRANAHGKPAIDPENGVRFNLSNSVGFVVCLVAEGAEVGVDVEPFERSGQIVKLASKVFSPVEQAQLEALPEERKCDRALSLWTLKESYIKARGMGLALPLDKFSFVFDDSGGIQLEIDPSLDDEPAHWRFCQLDYAGHRIAMMVERMGSKDVEVWEARPPLAAAARIDVAPLKWFQRA